MDDRCCTSTWNSGRTEDSGIPTSFTLTYRECIGFTDEHLDGRIDIGEKLKAYNESDKYSNAPIYYDDVFCVSVREYRRLVKSNLDECRPLCTIHRPVIAVG